MAATSKRFRKKLLLILSLTVNLGLLGFFKYYDFGIENLRILLEWLGFQAHPATLGIILPVGISFYTFQTIGYTVDVFRGRTEPAHNLLDFALYVAFCPVPKKEDDRLGGCQGRLPPGSARVLL